jgi:LCP family protein required for cell wall assembly
MRRQSLDHPWSTSHRRSAEPGPLLLPAEEDRRVVTQIESYSPRHPRRTPGDAPDPRAADPLPYLPPIPARPPTAQPESDRPQRLQPLPEELDRRGSHATEYGQDFSWVLIWTILGGLIPGTGLIAAGRRTAGTVLLAVLGVVGLGLAAFAVLGDPKSAAISLAVDPQRLLVLVIGAWLVGLAWALVILLTNFQLRRYATLNTAQHVFSGVVVLALIGGAAIPAYKVGDYARIQRGLVTSLFDDDDSAGKANAGPNDKKADPWADKPRVNILLIGSDAGRGRIGVRPDTMIVASINTKSGDAVLFSLPRNLERAPFPEGSPGKEAWPNGYNCGDECLLNAVWQWGSTAPGYQKYKSKAGLRATEDAIEGVTGLKIDTYAMLNLKGFGQFINAIGGLRVNVDQRLPIGGNSEHPEQTTGYIEAGKNQKLDGYETLWFARSRWSTNDFDRMRRQRCVIGAVVSQSDPVKLARAFPKIAAAAKNNISTGIPQRDLQAWVELSTKVKGGSVRSLPFTDQVIPNRADPDFDRIHRLVEKALKPVSKATPAPETASSPAASTDAKAKPKKPAKARTDPSKAQDVNEVC